jgi:hypothetical protein
MQDSYIKNASRPHIAVEVQADLLHQHQVEQPVALWKP